MDWERESGDPGGGEGDCVCVVPGLVVDEEEMRLSNDVCTEGMGVGVENSLCDITGVKSEVVSAVVCAGVTATEEDG